MLCMDSAAQMNMQCSLIYVYEFKLGYNTTEAAKNICCVKCESTVGFSTVTRWSKKFHLDCKNFNDQSKSGRPKTMVSISQSSLVHHHDLRGPELCLTYQNIAKASTNHCINGSQYKYRTMFLNKMSQYEYRKIF